ncbi:MAG TPA: ArsB/NhaD family transporter [Bacillales bacterium]|nr:ArsB/NhaD family transporter [Bacillales bacterium]
MATIVALSIFLISYTAIITEKMNRAFAACVGGLLMTLTGIVDVDDMLFRYIDWETIVLLFSMMVIVSITSANGVFEFAAVVLAQKVLGKPLPLLFMFASLTALGSAFLDNVTTVLLLVPIVLTITDILALPAVPYLTAIIVFSNIGGTATLIGDPPNIMIGQKVEHLGFNDFLVNLAPVVILIYAIVIVLFLLIYRRSLKTSKTNRLRLMNVDPASYLRKGPALMRSVTVLLLTICGFLFHPFFHVELVTVAMAGALLLVLLTYGRMNLESVFRSVEWMTLLFFAGLFMLVGGLQEAGVIDEMAKSILFYTEGDIQKTALFILWGSGLISGFVDNIPFVAAMIPVILEFRDYGMMNVDPLWWALSLGSCLGGNATLIGASANVIVAGLASKHRQPLPFFQFMKTGLLVVLLSLVISSIYLYFRYLVDFH